MPEPKSNLSLLFKVATDILVSDILKGELSHTDSFVKDNCLYWHYKLSSYVYINPRSQTALVLAKSTDSLYLGQAVTEEVALAISNEIVNYFLDSKSMKSLARVLSTALQVPKVQAPSRTIFLGRFSAN